MHGVAPSNQTMGLVALDADGNVILTDGYVTATGKPAKIAMKVSPSMTTCGSAALSSGTGTPGALGTGADDDVHATDGEGFHAKRCEDLEISRRGLRSHSDRVR